MGQYMVILLVLLLCGCSGPDLPLDPSDTLRVRYWTPADTLELSPFIRVATHDGVLGSAYIRASVVVHVDSTWSRIPDTRDVWDDVVPLVVDTAFVHTP